MNLEEKKPPGFLNSLKIPVSAALANLVGSVIIYPLDYMVTIFKSRTTKSESLQVIKQLYNKGGVYSFYRGLDTAFYETIPPNMIYFFAYDQLNRFLTKRVKKAKKWVPTISSFTAEVLSLLVLVPIETVRLRIQSSKSKYTYTNTWDGFFGSITSEGLWTLYRPSVWYIIMMTMYTTVQFSIYERIKSSYVNAKREYGIAECLKNTFISTSIAAVLTNPLDNAIVYYFVTDFTEAKHKNTTIIDIFRNKVHKYGVKGYSRGLLTRTFSHNFHFMFILPVYEHFRHQSGYDFDF